ncbi:MAG: oligosaccharide flippase family protein [Bacteroidota bacterium]|nr:oligosaccharide flippase family protein [Bacteroidota bacterium]
MELFARFKKDYFNYLISIILPALISGLSIPVFKNLLGAEGYGHFSIWLNAVLIITAVLSGWIAQSIIRFYPTSSDKYSFSRKAIILSAQTQFIFFIPFSFATWYISHDLILAILCPSVLLATSIQFTILPIIQSSFLSRKIIFSETIRIVSYVGSAIFLLKLSGIPYLYSLFVAVFGSYFISLFYLINQAHQYFRNQINIEKNKTESIPLFKSFFKYGAPLSLWFVFSYLLSYIDKLFMLKYFGGEAQGNYQAIFDLLFRSITLIISPIVTSLFPILTAAYVKGDKAEIREFLKKIILYELSGFLLVTILYWWFGFNLLFYILKIPQTGTYRLMGFIVICGTFIFQIAILAQKRYELNLKSHFLLKMVIIAFITQVSFYVVFRDFNGQLLYPLGFLLSTTVYLFLLSFSEIWTFSKSLMLKLKRG